MMTRNGRAFALMDLGAAIAALLILGALVTTGMAETRRAGTLEASLMRLEQWGEATGMFAADNEGELWGFSWQGGSIEMMADIDGNLVPTQLPETDVAAASYQAVHLIRTIGGRTGPDGMPIVLQWIANAHYSHLPLMEYLDVDPLDDFTSDPADRLRLAWKDDPINKFDNGFWSPFQPSPTELNRRWPYGSGFRPAPATWDVYQSDLRNGEGLRCAQSSTSNVYITPEGHQLGGALLDTVAFTANKVHVYAGAQRNFGGCRPHFAMPEARVALLMFDGSAAARATADANAGWHPNGPTLPCQLYTASPETQSGACSNDPVSVKAVYDWTRGGLLGVDFDGDPLDTGQIGRCPL